MGPANTTDFVDQIPYDGRYAYLVRAYNSLASSDWAIAITDIDTPY